MIDIGLLRGVISLDDQFSSTLEIAGRNLSTFVQRSEGVGRSLQSAGAAFLPFSAGVAALGAGILKLGIDFESSFAGVRKTVDASEPEFQRLAQAFRDMSKEIPVSVNELNRIAEAGGQLGVATKDIEQFTRVMADLGVATNLTSEAAAEGLAQFANIFDNELGPQFDRLGSTIVDLGNKSAATESQILDFGQRLAGAGKIAGLTEAEVLGMGTALASVGVNAEAGGTAFSKVMIEISAAVAGGGAQLTQFSEIAGKSTADFAKAFKETPAEAINIFVEGLGRIHREGGNLFATLESIGVTESRMRDSLLRMAGAGDLLRESFQNGRTAWEENIALTREAEQRYKTLESQLLITWNRIKDFGLTIANSLLPTIRSMLTSAEPLLDWLESAAKWFAELPQPIRATALALGVMAAGFAPLLIGLGLFVRAVEISAAGLATLIGFFSKSSVEALKNAGAMTTNAAAMNTAAAATERAARANVAYSVTVSKMPTMIPTPLPPGRGLPAPRQPLMLPPGPMMTTVPQQVGGGLVIREIGNDALISTTRVQAFIRAIGGIAVPLGVATAAVGAGALALRGLSGSWDFATKPAGSFIDILEDVGTSIKGVTEMISLLPRVAQNSFTQFVSAATGIDDVGAKIDELQKKFRESNWNPFKQWTQDWATLARFAESWKNSVLIGVAAVKQQAGLPIPLPGTGKEEKIDRTVQRLFPTLPTGEEDLAQFLRDQTATMLESMNQRIAKELELGIGVKPTNTTDTALADALKSLTEGRQKVVIAARAWVAHAAALGKSLGVGEDVLKLPLAIQEQLHEALHDVIGEFGSLEKAGLGAFKTIHEQLASVSPELKEFFDDVKEQNTEGRKDFEEFAQQGAFKLAEQMGRAFVEAREEQQKWVIDVERMSLSAYDFQIRQNQRWIEAERKKWADMGAMGQMFLADSERRFSLMNSIALQEREKVESKKEYEDTIDEFGRMKFDPLGQPIRIPGAKIGMSAGEEAGRFFAKRFSEVLIDTMAGGGNLSASVGALVGQSIGMSLFGGLTKKLIGGDDPKSGVSGMLGSIIGGVLIPGVGAMLGPLIGKGLDALGGLATRLAGNKTKGLREKFAQELGFDDLGSLYRDLEMQGLGGDVLAFRGARVVGRNDTRGNQQWMEDVRAFYEELERRQTRINELIGIGQQELSRYGGVVLPSMQPMIDELLESNRLTDEMRDALEGMGKAADWKAMKQIAEEYGIALEGLGKHFQQSRLDDLAIQYAGDFQFLAENGADVNAVLVGMQDEAQNFLDDVREFGLEIPENMRPLLQALVDAGLLIDESGDKLTDLGSFNFKAELETPFDRIVDVLEEIRDLLKDDIVDAFDDASGAARDYGDTVAGLPRPPGAGYTDGPAPDPNNPDDRGDTYDPNNPNDPYGGRDPSNPGYPWGTGLRFMQFGSAYETELHGSELVMTPDDVPDLATMLAQRLGPVIASSGGGRSGPQTIVINLAGRNVATTLLPDTLTALENNDGGGAVIGPRERMKRIVGTS